MLLEELALEDSKSDTLEDENKRDDVLGALVDGTAVETVIKLTAILGLEL